VPSHVEDAINPNDWVTLSPTYARGHGEAWDDAKILKGRVKASQLMTDGNSPHEFGYTGSAKIKPLAGVAAGSTAAAVAPLAFIEKRKQRPNSWIRRRFNEAASSVVEPAMTVGSMIAGDMALSAGALGTQFGHNLADGFQRQGMTSAESLIRPSQTANQFYENNPLPSYSPQSQSGQQGLKTLGNTLEGISQQPLVRDTIDYWSKPLNKLDIYLRENLGDEAVDNTGYLSNIVL
jgi:hypothetical protein